MRRFFLALLAFLVCATPVWAGSSGSVGGGTVTLSGDTSGPSNATVTSKLNGVTPGGSCSVAGQFVTSISASGVPSCAAPASSAVPYTTGLWYPFGGTYPGNVTFTPNRLYCSPGTVRGPDTPPAFGTNIRNLYSGGNIALALYADTTSNSGRSGLHSPGLLLGATGSLSTSSTTTPSNSAGVGLLSAGTPLSAPLVPGVIYWRCMIADNGSVNTLGNADISVMTNIGDSNLSNAPITTNPGLNGVYASMTYTASWPADLTSVAWTPLTTIAPDFYFQSN